MKKQRWNLLSIAFIGGVLALAVFLTGKQTSIAPKAYEVSQSEEKLMKRRGFVTSTVYKGNLGGLSGADQKCQERANAANLGGNWKAWLSDGTTSAASRLEHAAVPYVTLNGKIIANNWNDLTDGTIQNYMEVNEYGIVRPVNYRSWAWTNTKPDGTIYMTQFHCNNWTSSGGTAGGTGALFKKDTGWSQWENDLCSSNASNTHLYCFEQVFTNRCPPCSAGEICPDCVPLDTK